MSTKLPSKEESALLKTMLDQAAAKSTRDVVESVIPTITISKAPVLRFKPSQVSPMYFVDLSSEAVDSGTCVTADRTGERAPFLLSVPAPRGIPSVNLPAERSAVRPGVIVVIGETGAGKTTYLRSLGLQTILRFSEPYEDIDDEGNVQSFDSFESLLNAAIVQSSKGLIALDSIRRLVYELGGTTMTGGVSSSLFTLLTDLNNLFAHAGVVVYVSVNPMTGDEDQAGTLARRLAASVSGVVHLSRTRVVFKTFRLEKGRGTGEADSTSEAPIRASGSLLGTIAQLGDVDRLAMTDSFDNISPSLIAGLRDKGVDVRFSPEFTL